MCMCVPAHALPHSAYTFFAHKRTVLSYYSIHHKLWREQANIWDHIPKACRSHLGFRSKDFQVGLGSHFKHMQAMVRIFSHFFTHERPDDTPKTCRPHLGFHQRHTSYTPKTRRSHLGSHFKHMQATLLDTQVTSLDYTKDTPTKLLIPPKTCRSRLGSHFKYMQATLQGMQATSGLSPKTCRSHLRSHFKHMQAISGLSPKTRRSHLGVQLRHAGYT